MACPKASLFGNWCDTPAMFAEDELLPSSGLQHLIFCERQCALMHVEGLWAENRLTVQGALLHERVHNADDESRGNVRIARGLRLRSLQLGLSGVADVVEFHRADPKPDALDWLDDPNEPVEPDPSAIAAEANDPVHLPSLDGLWRPFPVEYKRGKPKPDACDEVQVCAQAICLEDMLGGHIRVGALFYGATRRRHDVAFDHALRTTTQDAAQRYHALVDSDVTPPAVRQKKCRSCSLLDLCLPPRKSGQRSAQVYLRTMVADNLAARDPRGDTP